MEENQSCKVLIDVTRSAYDDRQEDDGIRPIRVYLTIIPNLHSDCLVEGTQTEEHRWRILYGERSVMIVVYYESMKRKRKTKPIYECRCDGRLQTKIFILVVYYKSKTRGKESI